MQRVRWLVHASALAIVPRIISWIYSLRHRETYSIAGIYSTCNVSDDTAEKWPRLIKIKINIKYRTKQCTHTHARTLHTQQMVPGTWLGDHQGRPSTPLYRLNVDFMGHKECNYHTIISLFIVYQFVIFNPKWSIVLGVGRQELQAIKKTYT